MSGATDDWGLLSVADVIDGVVAGGDAETSHSGAASSSFSDETTVPGYLLDARFAPDLHRGLLSGLQRRLSARSTHIEHVFAVRFRKLKLSLSSSKQIRQRLNETIVSMGASLPRKEEHVSLLNTIALLGALTDNEEKGAYTSVLLDSVAHVNWDLACPQSCLELFQIVDTHTTGDATAESLGAAIARTKLGLALRSGRLTALLKCLLAPSGSLKLHPAVLPPRGPSNAVAICSASIDDFIVKTCLLPAQLRQSEMLRCYCSGRTVRLLGTTHMVELEAMGTMGTRLAQRSTQLLLGDRGDVVLYLGDESAITITALGREEHHWHFSVRRHRDRHGEDAAREEAQGRLAVRTLGLSLSAVRFHFCIIGADTLCCMVSSNPPQRTRGCLYCGEAALSSILHPSAQTSIATMKVEPLLRNPSFHAVSAMRSAFHFTKSVSVSVGRVTLKDEFHPFCIELWVYPRSVAKDQIFLSIGDKGVDEILLGLEPVGDGVRWRGGARTPRLGSSFASFNSTGKLSVLERWWHVALNFDGATWELWLDHDLVSRQPALVSPSAIVDAKCVLGKSFVGMAAEVRIWQHTRTGAQLVRDSRRPLDGTEEGLCGYFPLNEGYGNVIVDYALHHEHALLPYGEPYWCAVDTFPVLADPQGSRKMPDFVPLAWVEEADELFFAASPEAYTVAGVRSDHTLCVFDYARDHRSLVAQRSVELPAEWTVKSVSKHATRDSLICCATSPKANGGAPAAAAANSSAAVPVLLWEMWGFTGHLEAAPLVPYATSWMCGKAVLARSASHAQRFLTAVQYLTDQSSWAAAIPPFLLDSDDEVLTLLLRVAQRTSALTSQRDMSLAQQASSLLELNLLTRFYHSPQRFADSVGGCYDSVTQMLRTVEPEEKGEHVFTKATPPPLREAITVLALQPAFVQASSSALLRCCCQCFLDERSRVSFLEEHAGKPRSAAAETVYACLLSLYSSLHITYDMLASQPTDALASLFAALFQEAMYQVAHALRARNEENLRRTSHCLEVVAEVLLSGGGMEHDHARLEALQCAFSSALLHCCRKMVDAVAAALRQLPGAEATLLQCLQLSPVGALLASFSVSLPLLPTSALEACSTALQRCRESLLVLTDQFPGDEAKRWASRLCVAITYSLGQLGCTLLNPLPTTPDSGPAAGSSSGAATATPAYMHLLRNGQRRPNTERGALIKNLQSGVGAITKVFEELQKKDVSALRVVRDEEMKEMERQVMAACCALLLPTSALREATKESLQPAFQLVLKLRPWVLSKRQESKEYVAQMRGRAVFLALFEPIVEVDEDDAAGASDAGGSASTAASATSSRKRAVNPAATAPGAAAGAVDPRAARHADRKRWQRLFKSWKAMRQLKALMASREEAADMNVSAEVLACFQSDAKTSDMEAAVAWRSKKARYRLEGLQLLWQLSEEAHRSSLLARVLHPVIARTLCGWHYADGVDGCSVEQLTRLQSAFFHLMRAAIKAYAVVKETEPWELLLSSLLSCPFRRSDLRKLRTTSLSADIMRRLWSSKEASEVLYQRVNGRVPWKLRETKLTPTGCASTMTVGAAGLMLRSSGGRGSCVAPCMWAMPSSRKERFYYYYEVHVIDLYQGSYVSIGVGPSDYSLAQMPGWDPDSFAYDGFEGAIYTNRNARAIGATFGMGDIVGCGWNTESGEVFWTRNGKSVHSLKVSIASEQTCPLIGMKGRGCALVNFGTRPFVYQDWPLPASTLSRTLSTTARDELNVIRDGWDSFRLFSVRAATVLNEACAQAGEAPVTPSLSELAEPVGCCIDALVGALTPAADTPLSQSTLPPQFVTTLLGHMTLLCKLLRGVPESIAALHTHRLSLLCERMATRWLLATSRAALFTTDETETVTALLTAWYHAMYITPPSPLSLTGDLAAATGPVTDTQTEATKRVLHGGKSDATGFAHDENAETHSGAMPQLFLQILLQLAGCVLTTQKTRMSASETRHVSEATAPASVVTSCDTAHWLALSLLQRLNTDRDKRGSHAWQRALHVWLLAAFANCRPSAVDGEGKGSADLQSALLGLAILGGIPRLPVPGDTVTAHLGTHTVVPVVLLHASWAEEICEVLEVHTSESSAASVTTATSAVTSAGASSDASPAAPRPLKQSVKKLPLRFVHAVIQGDEPATDTFPVDGNNAHLELVKAVAQVTQVWLPLFTPATAAAEDLSCLAAQLSCLLARCAERQLIVIPPELIRPLSVMTGLADEVTSNMEQVRLDLVLSLWGLLQYRQRRGMPRGVGSATRGSRGRWNSSSGGGDEVSGRRANSAAQAGRGLVQVDNAAASPDFSSSALRLRTFAVLDPRAQQQQQQQQLLADSPAEPGMEYEDMDNADLDEEDDQDGELGYEDAEDDTDSVFEGRTGYAREGNEQEDDEDDIDGDESEEDMAVHRATRSRIGAAATLPQSQSQLSASSSPDTLFLPAEREFFDKIHFNGGCLRVASTGAVGLSFTLTVALRVTDIECHQILFAQVLRGGSTGGSGSPSPGSAVELVGRILHGNLEFGWLPCYPGEEIDFDPADPACICSFALSESDLHAWTRVTFVQSGTTLSLFRGGVLMDTRTMKTGGGSLLQEELRVGGIPGQLESTAFFGDVKGFRVYELALRPAMVEQLHRLNSSLSSFLESHLALVLKTTRSGVENTSRAPAAVMVDVATEGDVGYLDESGEAAARHLQEREACAQELDFSCDSEEADIRSLNEALPSQQSVLWHKKRSQSREQLLAICAGCYRQLAAFHSAHVLAHALCRLVKLPTRLPMPVQQIMLATLKDGTCVARLTQWAVSVSGTGMTKLLEEICAGLCEATGKTPDMQRSGVVLEMGNALLAELLHVAQQPQRFRTFESAHPQRPFASDVYDIRIPGQRSYNVFVDERSVASWRLMSISADRTMGAMVAEFYSTAISSFEVCLPHFFLTVRSAAETSNWGHRITVVYDYHSQLRAMRLFRSTLSALLASDGHASTAAMSFVWSVDCLMGLRAVAQRSTSKTRLLALTCLNDLFLFSQRFRTVPPPLSMPLLLHDMRRMAVRHYRRRLPTQRVLGRFIQIGMESYVMQRDAAQCWYAVSASESRGGSSGTPWACAALRSPRERLDTRASHSSRGTTAETAEVARFSQQRQEQLQLYRQRDSGADRVSIQKLRNSQSLTHEWSREGICVVRSDGSGGSFVAGVPLTAGRWYYELRVGGAGNICVGVLPVATTTTGEHEMPLPLTNAALQGHEPVAFNGCTGVFHDAEQQQRPFGSCSVPLWFSKDYLGVIMDVPARCCTILVNGVESVHFSFGLEAANESYTAAAAAANSVLSPQADYSFFPSRREGGRRSSSAGAGAGAGAAAASSPSNHRRSSAVAAPIAYYPYVSMEETDSVSLNFGAAYFEYEVPAGCLPLDPANLSLGTIFPYNQMRSLQDIAAHLFTGGRYPLPPFYYEEADPFAGSTERVGPAHVSVQASASVQVNMEDVKNVGLDFETVTGDCAVGAGAWYYEVTLRTQGLMQIGWMQRGETPHGNGHGVGDSSTSWAVDLFRRVMWHRGVPEAVNIPRRWAAGDVVGCALDMTHGELSFFLNGRPITGTVALEAESLLTETCTFQGIPQGLYYVPAVSLRSGGAVSFNFGSSPFKHKPEGFSPLGVPDSWNERMDTFYNNASPTCTMQRLMAMQEAWRVLSRAHAALSKAPATTTAAAAAAASGRANPAVAAPTSLRRGPDAKTSALVPSMEDFEKHLLPYRLVVQATDTFSDDVTKAFTKSAEDELRQHLASYTYPEAPSAVGGATLAAQSWDMFRVLKAISKIAHALLPFLSLNTVHPTLMTLLFLSMRTLLFRAIRRKLVESVLSVSSVRSEQYRVSINRGKAHANEDSVKASVFGQTFSLLGSQPARIFQTHQRFWNTVFLGEGAEDAGGPFREHLSEMCRELMSSRLPFFVPTANHEHNTGTYRDMYVPAASACSAYDLEAFVFLGKIMGGALRSEDPLDLFLPPLVWRFLCAYPITETEVEQVDAICVQCIREFRNLAATSDAAAAATTAASAADGGGEAGSPTELFDDVFGEEFFVTHLSDHSTKELIKGGARVRVTLARSAEYAEALLQARVHEFDLQLRKMREGLLSVVPEVAVLLLTPEELELRICGQADYKPDELRKGASYEGLTSEDRRVHLLWKALEAATPLQRRLFLRFVSGRDRLPVKLRVLPLTTQADPDTVLPRAATCFFAVELPDYSCLDVMKRKLFYSIENCADMDTDFNARVIDVDEAPQLSVALDDAQQDVSLPPNSDEE